MTEIVEMPAAAVAALPWEAVTSSNISRVAHVPTGAFICSVCGSPAPGSRAGDTTPCSVASHPSERVPISVPVVELHDLFVEFSNGSLYRYAAVPREDFDALMAAHLQEGGSVGKTLHARIKGRFPIVRVTVNDSNDEEGAASGDR